MIVTSLNLNGIRSATSKGLIQWIHQTQADVICFQELKAQEDQIPIEITELPYFKYYHAAQKKGYSGVGILTKQKPIQVEVGTGIDWIDSEGRVLVAEFESVIVISVYAPSGTTGDIRQAVKYQFLDAFFDYVHQLKTRKGKELIFCGDFNIAHKVIDIHNPVSNKNSSGFLPEEREWLTKFLESGFVDVYRTLNPTLKEVYSWWSFRAGARKNNKGWRIDYQLATNGIAAKAISARIDADVELSDHASVTIEYAD